MTKEILRGIHHDTGHYAQVGRDLIRAYGQILRAQLAAATASTQQQPPLDTSFDAACNAQQIRTKPLAPTQKQPVSLLKHLRWTATASGQQQTTDLVGSPNQPVPETHPEGSFVHTVRIQTEYSQNSLWSPEATEITCTAGLTLRSFGGPTSKVEVDLASPVGGNENCEYESEWFALGPSVSLFEGLKQKVAALVVVVAH